MHDSPINNLGDLTSKKKDGFACFKINYCGVQPEETFACVERLCESLLGCKTCRQRGNRLALLGLRKKAIYETRGSFERLGKPLNINYINTDALNHAPILSQEGCLSEGKYRSIAIINTSREPPTKRPPTRSENQWVVRINETMQTVMVITPTMIVSTRP